jgi:AsmA protein
MKKLLKIGIIAAAVIVLLIIGLTIFVKSFLSSERLKAFLLPRAETLTGRKVNLDQINVSLFKGIVVKGLSVKEKDGKNDFLKTGEFILSYRLPPLLKKQLVISKIEIVSPSITIKKEKGGKYNFSDLTEKGAAQPQRPVQPESRELPMAILADKLVVRSAVFTFVDEEKELPDVSAAFDAEFKGSLGKEGAPRLEYGLISLKEIKVKLKDMEVKTSGKIEMDAETVRATIQSTIGPDISAALDAEIKGSMGKEGSPRLESARITLKEIKAKLKDMEVKTSGKIDVDPKTVRASLQTLIGKDTIDINVVAKDYLSSPDIVGNINSKSLDLEKLMALGGDKKPSQAAPPKKEQKPVAAAAGSGPMEKLKASGQVKVDAAKFQDYTIKDFALTYQYAKGTMKVEPLGLQFSGGDAFTTEGSVKGNLHFTGQDAAAIMKTIKGTAEAKLGKGQVKQSKIFDAIAALTGIPDLKNPQVDDGLFNFDIKEERVNLDGFIRSSLFKLSPRGWVDFEKRLEVPAELKLAPSLSGRFGKGLASFKLLDDEQGWKVIPLKIKGTTDDPKVSLDEEALKKQLIPSLRKGLERLLPGQKQQEPGKPSQKTTPKDIFKGLFGK